MKNTFWDQKAQPATCISVLWKMSDYAEHTYRGGSVFNDFRFCCICLDTVVSGSSYGATEIVLNKLCFISLNSILRRGKEGKQTLKN